MEFHNYQSLYQCLHRKKKEKFGDFYTAFLRAIAPVQKVSDSAIVSCHQASDEFDWYTAKQPFYNVWPGITKMLCRLDLGAINPQDISLPLKQLLFRFAKNKASVTISGHELRTVLATEYYQTEGKDKPERWLCVWMDFGEIDEQLGIPVLTYRQLNLEFETIEQSFEKLIVDDNVNMGIKVTDDDVRQIVRLVLSLCLISTNASDELISPSVLTEDLKKYEDTLDPKYIAKAIRRGKYGWDIGRSIEVSAHWRQPHLALFWTGSGRQLPVIKLRKGSIIHKDVVETIPTGFEK